MSTDELQQEVPKLRMADNGVETPEHLVGKTGNVRVEMPEITMTLSYVGDGVGEYDTELVTFPPTDKDPINVPEGHVRIDGQLYEVVDDRSLNECPECGSDKVSSYDTPVRCYGCDIVIDGGEA